MLSRSTLMRRVAGALVALALLFPAAPVRAQGAAPSLTDSLGWDPAVRRGVLPNGIRWFVKKNGRFRANAVCTL